jgi:hypothetical protein
LVLPECGDDAEHAADDEREHSADAPSWMETGRPLANFSAHGEVDGRL